MTSNWKSALPSSYVVTTYLQLIYCVLSFNVVKYSLFWTIALRCKLQWRADFWKMYIGSLATRNQLYRRSMLWMITYWKLLLNDVKYFLLWSIVRCCTLQWHTDFWERSTRWLAPRSQFGVAVCVAMCVVSDFWERSTRWLPPRSQFCVAVCE